MGEDAAQRLRAEVEALVDWARRLDERTVGRRRSAEEWSAIECLAHTAELIPYWTAQAADVAARERSGEPFGRSAEDAERIAAVERGRDEPLGELLARVRTATADASATLRAIPDDGWSRSARHQRRGEMTVREFVDAFLIHHVREHVQQARAAIA